MTAFGLYPTGSTECLATVFDLRIPGTVERFHRERAAWGECAVVELLDLNHPVLIVRPGFPQGKTT